MEIYRSIDIEETIRTALSGQGLAVYCRPLPQEFDLPSLLVQNVGGYSTNDWAGRNVVDTFTVTIDSRAQTESEALSLLRNAIGILQAVAAEQSTAIAYVEINSQYSWGQDPVRPDLAMCSATLIIRAHTERVNV